jgi:2-polyprenyl-3-methyl-5-hydroxy-6-metoxy-1,4-benzoquinol methylase
MTEQEHWESRYRGPAPPPWDTGRPSAELLRRLSEFRVRPCRAIELGCGTGSNAVWLARQGFDVTGVDISPSALERATKHAFSEGVNVHFLQADIMHLPELGPRFDFFFDRGCYHAVRRVDASGFLNALDRITAPEAMGIVLTGNAKEERKPGPPAISEETIRAELGSKFEIVSLEEFRFDQDEPDGKNPLGWSCVLRKRSSNSGKAAANQR